MNFSNTLASPLNSQGIRRPAGRQRAVPAIILCLLLAACGTAKPIGVVGHVQGFGGMVAADEPRAAMLGRSVLSAGGSATDAAVAMSFAMSVTLPSEVGLGAGGVCLVYDRQQEKTEVIDFVAPPTGASAAESAIPALPRGMYALHARYGKLKWEQLLAEAEGMARLGVPVSRALGQQLAGASLTDENARRIFTRPDGQPLAEGDTLIQPDLGATLARLRVRGVGDFYAGNWSADLANAAKDAGVSLTPEALRGFTAQWKAPVEVAYGNNVALFPPSPAAGSLEAEWWAALARDGAYASADAAGRPPLLAKTESRGFAGQTGAGLQGAVSGSGLVAIDGEGSAVACSLSLNKTFGSGRILPGTGILLAARPAGAGQGPYGAMLGVNRNSNEFRYAAAVGSGATASTSLLEVSLATLIGQVPLPQAIAAPRLSAVNDVVRVEPGNPAAGSLEHGGLKVEQAPLPGRVNAIVCGSGNPNSERCAVATDPRGYGLAATMGGG
jgi:gamma-glutamyltranspeptidase / glutathione hydrolase